MPRICGPCENMRNGLFAIVRMDGSHQNSAPVVDNWPIRVYNMLEEPFCVIQLFSNQRLDPIRLLCWTGRARTYILEMLAGGSIVIINLQQDVRSSRAEWYAALEY